MVGLLFVAALLAVAAASYLQIYKSLVRKDNLCESAWEVLDAQLARRSETISKLLADTPTPSEEHNAELQYLARMQAAVDSATKPESKMSASAELTSVLNALISSSEIKPELQQELEDVDTKLTYARASYNDCVRTYNDAITTFPGKPVARKKFLPRQSFEAVGDTARQHVTR